MNIEINRPYAFTLADFAFTLADFPEEILTKIFSDLPVLDIIKSSRVCKNFKETSQDSVLWKFRVENALKDQAPVEEICALALIHLFGKFRPRNEDLGYQLGARAEEHISKKPEYSSLELFILSHVRLYYTLDLSYSSKVSESQKKLSFVQKLIAEKNPFALYSQGLCDHANKKFNNAKKSFQTASGKSVVAQLGVMLCGDNNQALKKAAEEGSAPANYFLYMTYGQKFQQQNILASSLNFLGSLLKSKKISSEPLHSVEDKNKYLQTAAENGFHPAQFDLAKKLLEEGELLKYCDWALKAMAQNNAQAKILLGMHYLDLKKENGLSSEQLSKLEEMAAAKEKEVYFYLGRIISEPKLQESLSKEEKEAVSLLQSDIQRLGWTPYVLCLLYIKGSLFNKDSDRAMGYYHQFRTSGDQQMAVLKDIRDPKDLSIEIDKIHEKLFPS